MRGVSAMLDQLTGCLDNDDDDVLILIYLLSSMNGNNVNKHTKDAQIRRVKFEL